MALDPDDQEICEECDSKMRRLEALSAIAGVVIGVAIGVAVIRAR